MEAIQLPLRLSEPPRNLTPEQKVTERKLGLIKGRPRRLAPRSLVVKVAVRPELVPTIDRVRSRMNGDGATRPGYIRAVVDSLIARYGDATKIPPPLICATEEKAEGRCEYWKVPLSPRALRGVDALAVALGWVSPAGKPHRQKVVTLAIKEMISRYV